MADSHNKMFLYIHSKGHPPAWRSIVIQYFTLNIPIPKYIFNEDYPVDPKTFRERLRRTRMDAGLLIKEFSALIGVTPDTVINCWEVRGMKPWRRDIRKKVNLFVGK